MCISNSVFNGVAKVEEHLRGVVLCLLCIDTNQVLPVLCLDRAQKVTVLLQSALHDGVSVLALLNQAGLCVVRDLI